MRRFLAIALALLIGLPTISPLFALSAAEGVGRPICCRRDGKHHCMLVDMDMGASAAVSRPSSGTRFTPATISERCPYGSRALPGVAHRDWTPRAAAAIFSGIAAHPSIAPQTESKRRISADRSRHKRGPPATTLA